MAQLKWWAIRRYDSSLVTCTRAFSEEEALAISVEQGFIWAIDGDTYAEEIGA